MPAVLVVFILCLAVPASSDAAIAAREADTLVYRAAAGEANRVDVSQDGGRVTFAERPETRGTARAPLLAGTGCEGEATVACDAAGIRGVRVELGDEADIASLSDPGRSLAIDAVIEGGAGNDQLQGGAGNDSVLGGIHSDTLLDSAGADFFDGGAGSLDRIEYRTVEPLRISLDGVADDGRAGEGDDVDASVEDVAGGAGPDTIVGSAKKNQLLGGGGDDVMNGGGGGDRVRGHDGDDRLTGGAGEDLLDGAAGDDLLLGRDGERDKIACRAGPADRASVDRRDRVYSGCERVRTR